MAEVDRLLQLTKMMDFLFSSSEFSTVVFLMLSMMENVKANRNGNTAEISMNWVSQR